MPEKRHARTCLHLNCHFTFYIFSLIKSRSWSSKKLPKREDSQTTTADCGSMYINQKEVSLHKWRNVVTRTWWWCSFLKKTNSHCRRTRERQYDSWDIGTLLKDLKTKKKASKLSSILDLSEKSDATKSGNTEVCGMHLLLTCESMKS